MLSFLGPGVRLCDGITRREMLRVGGLGFTGLLWSDWLRARTGAAARSRNVPGSVGRTFGKAKACILVFNYGGPSHLDILDLKPDAPREIRGEFKPAATSVPGMSITEHLPRLARLANQYALVRSVNHRDNDHAIGAYLALTGYSHPKNAILGIEPPATPQDLPSIGSLVSRLRPTNRPVFSYITLGDLRHFGNNDSLGQNAGCMGYDPFTVPFLAWLLGILTHNGKDWRARFLRTAKRQLKRELSLDHPKLGAVLRRNLLADTPAPITSLMQDEIETVLRRRIGELPERYARVIHMHSMQELPFEKVAQALRCTVEAARKVYRRAITQLSESLRDIV